jgi:glycosyltransferase involved in cell wall biosynthesis
MKLSVVLAVRNEEENIKRCLESVSGLADEIIVVDEHSTDKTREIAEKLGAKVFLEPHHDIFHVSKQKALDYATGDWILQLDADEVVGPDLAKEIGEVLAGKHKLVTNKLFEKHQRLIQMRDGVIGKESGDIVGYFIPRRNIFLGKPLIHAGGYPDGVIRLVKNGKAQFPQKDVHEQIRLDGRVGWLGSDLLHYDSPTLNRYLTRMNRYTDLKSRELRTDKVGLGLGGFLLYVFWKPLTVFLNLFIRHKGFLDGATGFLWSFFSALHYPVAYFKYLTNKHE